MRRVTYLNRLKQGEKKLLLKKTEIMNKNLFTRKLTIKEIRTIPNNHLFAYYDNPGGEWVWTNKGFAAFMLLIIMAMVSFSAFAISDTKQKLHESRLHTLIQVLDSAEYSNNLQGEIKLLTRTYGEDSLASMLYYAWAWQWTGFVSTSFQHQKPDTAISNANIRKLLTALQPSLIEKMNQKATKVFDPNVSIFTSGTNYWEPSLMFDYSIASWGSSGEPTYTLFAPDIPGYFVYGDSMPFTQYISCYWKYALSL